MSYKLTRYKSSNKSCNRCENCLLFGPPSFPKYLFKEYVFDDAVYEENKEYIHKALDKCYISVLQLEGPF